MNLLAAGETIDGLVADYKSHISREAMVEAIQKE